MFKKYYQQFLQAHQGTQHYLAHAHHYWPDVTREAMIAYWDDSAKYVDQKWDYFSAVKIPETQKLIAQNLSLSQPEQIVFASNTHELFFRLLSCFEPQKKIKVLTSDAEFLSFTRQAERLQEDQLLSIEVVPTLPFDDFEERIIEKLKCQKYDLVYLSQVFYNSGLALKDLKAIVKSLSNARDTLFVVDGYHAFMAVPTDLSSIENDLFYLAGSYKYAQGGEGCCFMTIPKNFSLKPRYTGWFAEAPRLSSSEVSYFSDARRFAGSTMDYSALYRLHATLSLFQREGISTQVIHAHVQKLQRNFRQHLLLIDHPFLTEKNILSVDYNHHGHFYAFAMPSVEHAMKLQAELKGHNILTDYRGSRLRFGFGLYQDDCINLSALKLKR